MSKKPIAAIKQQGIPTPKIPKRPILVNQNCDLSRLTISRDDVATISNQAFDASYKLLSAVGISDLITGEGFNNFADLGDDRQEALLAQLLSLTHAALQSVEAIRKCVDSRRFAGGES